MEARRENRAHDPLTEVGGKMLETFEAEVESREIKSARAIVLISRPDPVKEGRTLGGIAISGYNNDAQTARRVADDLLYHARAILRTLGLDMQVIELSGDKQPQELS